MPRCERCHKKIRNGQGNLCNSCDELSKLTRRSREREIDSLLNRLIDGTKCYFCNKNINDLGNRCKTCGQRFCNEHRLFENHKCLNIYPQESLYSPQEDAEKNQIEFIKSLKKLIELQEKLNDQDSSSDFKNSGFGVTSDNLPFLTEIVELNIFIQRPIIAMGVINRILEVDNSLDKIWFWKGEIHKIFKDLRNTYNSFRASLKLKPNDETYKKAYLDTYNQIIKKFSADLAPLVDFEIDFDKDFENIISAEEIPSFELIVSSIIISKTPPELLQDLRSGRLKKKHITNEVESIEKQLERLDKKYNIDYLNKENRIFDVLLGYNNTIRFDVRGYPECPKIEFFDVLKEHQDEIYNVLYYLKTWDVNNPYNLNDLILEMEGYIGYLGQGDILISEQYINRLYEIAESYFPKEMMGFMQMDRWILYRVRMPIEFTSSVGQAAIKNVDIPKTDPSIIGMVHSHTIGPPIPSSPDLNSFRNYKYNMIIGLVRGGIKESIKLFDSFGTPVRYKIIRLGGLSGSPKLQDSISKVQKKQNYESFFI